MTIHSITRLAARGLALVATAALLSGCLTMKAYVDPALPVVGKADLVAPATPRPVQVAFEFKTKGSVNASATSQIKPRIIAVASESGLFSAVTSSASDSADAGLLTVVIDNVPITDNAAAKGFGTGLTLGAVGSMVTDGYVATARYQRDGVTTEVTAKHALHTTIGNKAGPEGLTPVTMQQGVETVMDQLMWNLIKQLAEQKALE